MDETTKFSYSVSPSITGKVAPREDLYRYSPPASRSVLMKLYLLVSLLSHIPSEPCVSRGSQRSCSEFYTQHGTPRWSSFLCHVVALLPFSLE